MRKMIAVGLLPWMVLAGCRGTPSKEKDYAAPLREGQFALQQVTRRSEIPDFTRAFSDRAGLRQAVKNSLNYLGKPSSKRHFPMGPITHARTVASLRAFVGLLETGIAPHHMNTLVRLRFDVYRSVGCDGEGTVLFTGYYTPTFNASLRRTGVFRFPLYKPPPGLVKDDEGRPVKPLPDRRTIERSKMYAGNELAWLADPFEVYIVHVQGSARLRLPDGKEITVGYAANNGHPYKSIRAELVREGKIGKAAGMPSMIAYFRAHPGQIDECIRRNPRFIFFAVVPDGQPRGCLNEPVIALRSIATDKRIFPRAALAFVSADLPRSVAGKVVVRPYTGFALDQDAGGAIRAPGRCDVYMGEGAQARARAGRAKHEGRLYYLFLKPEHVE